MRVHLLMVSLWSAVLWQWQSGHNRAQAASDDRTRASAYHDLLLKNNGTKESELTLFIAITSGPVRLRLWLLFT